MDVMPKAELHEVGNGSEGRRYRAGGRRRSSELYVCGTNLCHLMNHLKTDDQYEAILLSILPRCGSAFQKLVGL